MGSAVLVDMGNLSQKCARGHAMQGLYGVSVFGIALSIRVEMSSINSCNYKLSRGSQLIVDLLTIWDRIAVRSLLSVFKSV